MKALILVDLQNDFVSPGALPVPGGGELIDFANQQMEGFELVVATQDWHPQDHGSFASQHEGVAVGTLFDLDGLPQVAWPDHCIQSTWGAEFLPGLHCHKIDRVFQKGTDKRIDSYSGFFDNGHRRSTGMAEYLQEKGVRQIFIMGLATDYCVKFTALDALQLGFSTHLLRAGCRGVELHPGDIAEAISEMARAGVVLD